MISRTYRRLCNVYGYSYILNLSGSIFFKSISLLKDLIELFKLLLLCGYPILTPDTLFLALFIAKYIDKDL